MKIRLPAASWAAVIPVAILIGTIAGVGGAGASAQSAPIAQSGPAAATRSPAPFVPQPILPGGQIVTLFPPSSRYLKKERIGEAEVNNLQKTVPGRIQSIVNIHNPSIEVHFADPGNNTGAAVILAPGGGHHTLNVGSEGADFVPFFYNYGVNTIILRNRLRSDGYDPLDRRGQRHSAGHPHRPRPRGGVEDRSAEDRHHGLLGRRRAVGAGGDQFRRVRRREQTRRAIRWRRSARGPISSR